MSEKLHYFLVTGTLYVRLPNPTPEDPNHFDVAVPTLNVVVRNDKPHFGMHMMAQANTGLQVRYREESKDETGIVDNIVLNSVFSMGYMTQEEYEYRPAPTAQNAVGEHVKAVAAKAKQGKKS